MAGHQRTLSAYLDGELTAREQRKLEQALTQDSALRAELDELRRTVEMVRSLPTLAAPRSFALDPAVYGRVKPRRFYLYPVMRAATVVAMLVFAFLFAGDFLIGGGAMAPAQEVQSLALEVTQVVEKEVAIPEAGEMEQPKALEMPEEPAVELLAETVAEYDEAGERGLEEPAELMVEEAPEGESAPEAEPNLTVTTEMGAAEESEAVASSPPVAEPAEGGASAGGEVPTVAATPHILPTVSPSEDVAQDTMPAASAPDVSPTVLPAGTVPPPAAEEALAIQDTLEPTATLRQVEPAREREPGVDWALMSKLGVGLLAAGLLVVTLLARRFNW